MCPKNRRAIWFIVLPLLVLGVVVAGWFLLHRPREPIQLGSTPVYDAPTELASISVPHEPSSLTWSRDGAHLAAGTRDSGQVYVIDVARTSVATLRVTGYAQALAFSPDGKWLAVATQEDIKEPLSLAVLVVFDVPGFTAKFTAKANAPKPTPPGEPQPWPFRSLGFLDVAWAPDSNALCAIDQVGLLEERKHVRRWSVPAFNEQAAIPETAPYSALAVSPDGRTLAVRGPRVIRLLDLGKGTEQSSIQLGPKYISGRPIRLGFTPDGKTLGVFGADNSDPDHPGFATEWRVGLYWWDVATGREAKPDPARFAIQPAGLAHVAPFSTAVSVDGTWKALGSESHLPFQGENRSGAFIRLTKSATGETRTWRVGETRGSEDAPVLAFSPDGRKLAGTVLRRSQEGGALDSRILIWPVPR
jgi:WD40 repeat protein